ncbi:hypothetical protein MASR1M107_30150 [Ignavibacteriales bacterium]
MKKLINSLLFLTFPLMAQWVQIAPATTAYDLTTVCALSTDKVLVAGKGGVISISTNRGIKWETKVHSTREDFLDGDFYNENIGILSTEGNILKTTNGGESWVRIYHSDNDHIIKVKMFDAQNYVAVSNSNYLIRSSNGGQTWERSSTIPEGKFHAASLNSMNEMYLLADTSFVVTTDGGTTFSSWLTTFPPLGATRFDVVYFADSQHGVVTKMGGSGIKTTDGGHTWNLVEFPSIYSPRIYGIHGVNEKVMITGEFRFVLKTSDIGSTWSSFTPAPTQFLYDVTCFRDSIWFACGSGGAFQSSTDFGATWNYFPPSTTDKRINKIFFLNEEIGYIAYTNGLKKTTNGGNDWIAVNDNLPMIPSIHFFDEQNGLVLDYENIFRTTDGGVTLSTPYSFSSNAVFCVLPNGKVLVAGPSGTMIKSADRGATWTNITTNTTKRIRHIYFLDSLTGFFVATDQIGKSTDGGETWQVNSTSANQYLQKFVFYDQLEGVGIEDKKIFHTSDGGRTWVLIKTAENFLRTIVRDGDQDAIMCSYLGQILRSHDRGMSWQLDIPITSVSLSDIFRTNAGTLYVSGDKGTVLKESESSNIFVGIEDESHTLPVNFSLYQNYPNPFNPETVIRFSLPEGGFVKGVVYDILGREVAKLLKSDLPAGNHQVKFDATGIASGVYVFRLEAGKYSSAIKMLVNK